MCHSRDFRAFDKREAKTDMGAGQRRAGAVETIRTDAKREAEKAKPERASAQEAALAK